MANEKNLKPQRYGKEKSIEKAKQEGRKGGIISGIVKRRKKTFQELAQEMLAMKTTKKVAIAIKKIMPELKEEEITGKIAMIARQYEKALKKCDSKAFEVLRDTSGEKPAIDIKGELEEDITIKVKFPK